MHGLRPLFVKRAQRFVTYDRGMLVAAASAVAGVMLLATLVYRYLNHGLRLEAISHPAILGLLLIILGFQTFCFTLLMEMAQRVASTPRQCTGEKVLLRYAALDVSISGRERPSPPNCGEGVSIRRLPPS